jgi:hypothetical protein
VWLLGSVIRGRRLESGSEGGEIDSLVFKSLYACTHSLPI